MTEHKGHTIEAKALDSTTGKPGRTLYNVLIDGKDPQYVYTDTSWCYDTEAQAVTHAKQLLDGAEPYDSKWLEKSGLKWTT